MMTSATAPSSSLLHSPQHEATAWTTSNNGCWVILGTALNHTSQRRTIAESATSPSESFRDLRFDVQQMFRGALYEMFDEGMESDFSRRLVEVIGRFGESAVLEIAAFLSDALTPAHVAAEALRWLGLIRDSKTHAIRRWVLCDSLTARSVLIRDGAIVGLTYLNDPSTRKFVELAQGSEKSQDLQADMAQLVDQLDFPEKGYVLSFEEGPQSALGPSLSN
jgi:hypothetical protein